MSPTYINQFGRRPGRGVRPWLLLPKVLAVAVYIGGLAAALGIWLMSGFSALNAADPQRLWTIDTVSRLMRFLVVPALLAALVLGLALLLQHPKELARRRWLLLKLTSLLILIPAGHLFVSSRLGLLRHAFTEHATNDAAARQFTWGLSIALAGSMWVVILGRLKPRFGQKVAAVEVANER